MFCCWTQTVHDVRPTVNAHHYGATWGAHAQPVHVTFAPAAAHTALYALSQAQIALASAGQEALLLPDMLPGAVHDVGTAQQFVLTVVPACLLPSPPPPTSSTSHTATRQSDAVKVRCWSS